MEGFSLGPFLAELCGGFGPYLLSCWDLFSAEGGWGPGPGGEADSATSQGGIACHPHSEGLHGVPVRKAGSVTGGQVMGRGGLIAEQMPVGSPGRGLLGGQPEGHPERAQWLPWRLSEGMCGWEVWAG